MKLHETAWQHISLFTVQNTERAPFNISREPSLFKIQGGIVDPPQPKPFFNQKILNEVDC